MLARQYGGSKVIFWIQFKSYRKDFSKSRDIHETFFLLPNIYLNKNIPMFQGRLRPSWIVKTDLPQLSNLNISSVTSIQELPFIRTTFVHRWKA